MADVNKHGLTRHIPARVRREVRQRSRFGCVVCRRGFYQYEHIDPTFADAERHDPDAICCLCGACHDAVTLGQRSKESIASAYRALQGQDIKDADPPVGPLDFHDGSAELSIGGLLYSPAVRTVLRHNGKNLIRVTPGTGGSPGLISAVFTDDRGRAVLRLIDNVWIGSLDNWDIEIVSQRLTVRQAQGRISLQLRLDPPGRIVIERLDMRVQGAHVLVSPTTYAVGRYLAEGSLHWVHAHIQVERSSSLGAAIEFADPEELEKRDRERVRGGAELADEAREIVINSNLGVMVKPLGIAIASLTGAFALGRLAIGVQSLEDMRRVILRDPDELPRFIATGKVTED